MILFCNIISYSNSLDSVVEFLPTDSDFDSLNFPKGGTSVVFRDPTESFLENERQFILSKLTLVHQDREFKLRVSDRMSRQSSYSNLQAVWSDFIGH